MSKGSTNEDIVDDKSVKTDDKPVSTDESKVKEAKKSDPVKNKNILIGVLSAVIACIVIVFAVLLCTGVIKFGDDPGNRDRQRVGRVDDGGNKDRDKKRRSGEGRSNLIDNPNQRITMSGTHVEVDDLEFYLPSAFKDGGKNKDGAYTYNLSDDDGWAQVLVYAERSSLSASEYLNKISANSIKITDDDYDVNGTEWVVGESGGVSAYATKLGGKVYAVYYAVKLDSTATNEAKQMIPKTLYMKKVVADDVDDNDYDDYDDNDYDDRYDD